MGVSQAKMENGEMRCDANISMRHNEGEWNSRVEIKNVQGLKMLEKAIEYEIL